MDNDNTVKVGVSNKEGQLGFMFTRGGIREGSGRKSIGVTKKISLTLPEELWAEIEKHGTEHQQSRSEVIRNILDSYYSR
ncbi:ribbon-helix-helix domain-containing protein [Paenibacillus lemnae]|uniref:Ribbon-helix-helix protein, CopG family n=1 Tax=Paenibacillus lemnae TaxID=1330551 RepID=A0A848M067_PAELE|nr:ribbon-helix-helix domain-containing protein [Paenibacillus lemnae]NMO94288.1 ribbon-helix-helix protein, CopG family [Paenibacillus lemnae]